MRIHHDQLEYLYIFMEYHLNMVNIEAPALGTDGIVYSWIDPAGKREKFFSALIPYILGRWALLTAFFHQI